MRFIATRAESDGRYSEEFDADTWATAQIICDSHGWHLDGELRYTIPAEQTSIEQMDRLVDALNERDEHTAQ